MEWHIKRFKSALENGGRAFGCFEWSTLVGYAVTVPKVINGNRYLHIDQLFVSKDSRGKGIGKNLMWCCDRHARSCSIFFADGKDLGYEFSEDMPVVFEDFEVVYRED